MGKIEVTVLAFATASDLVGKGPQKIELEEGSRLSELRQLLTERHPRLDALWPRLAVAVNGTLVTDDPELPAGAEVALLPPVSGGAPSTVTEPAQDLRAALIEEAIDVAAVERQVASDGFGAVLLFVGTVRNHHQGRSVDKLTYSAYASMARQRLTTIVDDLEAAGSGRDEVRAAIVHRLGDVPVGEPSVVIAIASPHREACYSASRTALERLKAEVPIWKREHYADGDVAWREEEPLLPTS